MKKIIWIIAVVMLGGQQLVAQIANQAEDIAPLLISEKIPSVALTSLEGQSKSMETIMDGKPSILLFYRGGWCPYCNAHLSAVGEVKEEVSDLGYQIIGIAPDSPEKLKQAIAKNEIDYLLYSDASGELIKAMGLAFQAPHRYDERLADYSGGKNPGILPVPSLYVVNEEGVVVFQYVNPDYKYRIGAELLLHVLKDLK